MSKLKASRQKKDKTRVNLESFLQRLVTETDQKIRKKLSYAVFPGGKRIRPLTLLKVAQALGGDIRNALPSACAIELIHCYSLVHDDLPCMDDSPIRRGKPSCHVKFGEAEAVLIGDGLQSLAFYAIAKYTPKKSLVAPLVNELAKSAGANGMVLGQALDLSDKKSEYINLKKTANLFIASAKMGAISAEADGKTIARFEHYGTNLGLLFQLADDVQDGKNKGRVNYELAVEYFMKAHEAIRPIGDNRWQLVNILENVLKQIVVN